MAAGRLRTVSADIADTQILGRGHQVEPGRAVVTAEEDRLPAVCPLCDMVGHSRDNSACKTSHDGTCQNTLAPSRNEQAPLDYRDRQPGLCTLLRFGACHLFLGKGGGELSESVI